MLKILGNPKCTVCKTNKNTNFTNMTLNIMLGKENLCIFLSHSPKPPYNCGGDVILVVSVVDSTQAAYRYQSYLKYFFLFCTYICMYFGTLAVNTYKS